MQQGPRTGPGKRRLLQTNVLVPVAIALGALLAGAIYTWFVGEDVNWDWQNYHEYNVWAVINGRYGIDALPAGFQTYFNPAVYFPVYYLRHLLPLPYGLMIMGAVHGLNLLLIYFLIRAPAAGNGDGERDRRIDPDCRGRADDAFGSGHELLRHPHRASDSGRLRPDPVGGWIASWTLRSRRPADRRGRRAEADQRRLCARCRRRRARRRPAAAGNALPRRWRRDRRAGDRRRVGADALARDGQSDFPALQRRVPVPGIGPDEHHGLAVPAAGPAGRAGLSLLLAGRRQQEFGISVPRRAVCGRDRADRARHRPRPRHAHRYLHPPRYPVPAVLRRLLCGMARRVFDPALRDRAGAVVRAADRSVDCTLHGRRARICPAPRIFAAH